MGNETPQVMNQKLYQIKDQLVKHADKFNKDVLAKNKQFVPIRHLFLKKMKFSVTLSKDKGEFFRKLGNVFKGVAKVYSSGFDPDLFTDVCDFIGMVAGSSKGKLQEQRFYSVQKLGTSIIRVDILTVVKHIENQQLASQKKIAILNCFSLSSIDFDSLDENEKELVHQLKEFKQLPDEPENNQQTRVNISNSRPVVAQPKKQQKLSKQIPSPQPNKQQQKENSSQVIQSKSIDEEGQIKGSKNNGQQQDQINQDKERDGQRVEFNGSQQNMPENE